MTHYRLTGLLLREICVRLLWLAIGAFVVLLVASWVFPQLNLRFVESIFSTIIADPIKRWVGSGAFEGVGNPTDYIGIIVGILSALLTFTLTAALVRENQRKQSTLQILVESRFSPILRKVILNMQKEKPMKSDVAAIINYYEFLAVGVIQRNLDEAMLEKTIRGFLCGAAYRWRDLIYEKRVTDGRHASYENLVAVYWRWMDESREDERGKPGDPLPDLGSRPWQWVSKTHKFLHSRQPIYYLAGVILAYIVYGVIF